MAASSAGHADLSADGRYVVDTALSAAGPEVFRKDLASGNLVQVSTGAGAGWNADPSISADGRYVSFGYETREGTPGAPVTNEVFVRDLLSGELTRVTHGVQAGQGSFYPSLSADGGQLAFVGYAGTLGEQYDVSWDVVSAHLALDSSVSARGTAGNDLFISSNANDAFNGGAGLDVVAYRGTMAQYDVHGGATSRSASMPARATGPMR